jgi:transposase-like protein
MNRKKYTNEFKVEAVRLAERGDVPVAQLARDMGICETALYRWIKQFGKNAEHRVTPDEHEELIRLRRECRILKEEREILKKAAAYFAREQL